MSLKGQRTTADYLPWNEMLVLVQKLARDKDYDFAVLIATGSYTGLRISDLRTLKWENMTNPLVLNEKKTGKSRTIHLHDDLLLFLDQVKPETKPKDGNLLFDLSIQYTNRKLKRIATDYELNIKFSTHSFRKTFGRRIWEKNNHSEKALILLGQVFNHSSVAITKRYLGIRDKEIQDIYLNL
jgi:integrase